MTPEQIAESIRQQLAQKERDDLEQLGRAQTGGPMTEIKPDGYLVVIQRAADGVERTYEMKDCSPPEGPDDFWWTDGNGACDCNRGDFFGRADGHPDADEECGSERFLVLRFILRDGTIIAGPDAPSEITRESRP